MRRLAPGGRIEPEQAADLDRTRWPISTGLGGRIRRNAHVISEIVRAPGGVRAGFISRFSPGSLPCFTVYSTFELRRRPDVYAHFLDFFDVFPCGVLKSEDQLFEDELAAYASGEGIDPTLVLFSPLNKPIGTNLRNVMDVNFKNRRVLRREQKWLGLKTALIGDWLALKANFPPKGERYTVEEGDAFVEEATRQRVQYLAPDWARAREKAGEQIRSSAFPSSRMILWTLFYRFYLPNRTPETQDVFDVLISSPAPYLDAVVTEKHQAEIYRQVRMRDPAVGHLEIYTVADLRA